LIARRLAEKNDARDWAPEKDGKKERQKKPFTNNEFERITINQVKLRQVLTTAKSIERNCKEECKQQGAKIAW